MVPDGSGSLAFDVIVCGSLHLDVMVYSPRLPRADETVVGTKWALQCGGKGGNQAVMASRAGARVAMIGRVGADDFGARLRRRLVDAGVNSRAVLVDESVGSGMSAAIVRDDGDYGAVIVSGANLKLEDAAVASQWKAIGGARVLVLQNEIPEPANLAAANAAHSDGALVILNAAPVRVMTEALLDRVDCLVVNQIEAEMLSGGPIGDRGEAASALSRVGGRIKNVIVTSRRRWPRHQVSGRDDFGNRCKAGQSRVVSRRRRLLCRRARGESREQRFGG